MGGGILDALCDADFIEANIVIVNMSEHVAVRDAKGCVNGESIINGAGYTTTIQSIVQENVHGVGC